MKISKLYISAFGGLKDFTLELNDGFNVIYGENENGKSTVMAFIKAMFYGTGKKSQNLASSMRQKYTPWSGECMGGRIYFEDGGKCYCLEREFRSSDSTDRITLTDLDTNKPEQVQSDIGESFFGIGSAAFERSMFIGNSTFSGNIEAEGEFNLKLSNLAFTGDEDTSYTTVEKRIESARTKLISKTGRVGSCVEDINRYNELGDRYATADRNAQRKIEINEALARLEEEYKHIYAEYNELSTLLENENMLKNADKLRELLDTKAQLDQVNKSLTLSDGTILDGMFINKITFNLNRLEQLSERISGIKNDVAEAEKAFKLLDESSPEERKKEIIKLNNDLNALRDKKAQIDSNIQKTSADIQSTTCENEANKSRKKPVNLALLCIAIALDAIGGALLGSFSTVAIVIFVCAAILLCLSFIIRPLDKGAAIRTQGILNELSEKLIAQNKELQENVEQSNELTQKINTLTATLNADAAVKEQKRLELEAKNDALAEETAKRDTVFNELISTYSKYSDEHNIEQIKESLTVLSAHTENQKQIKLRLNYLSQDLGNISYEDAAQKLEALAQRESDTGIDFTAVRQKAKGLAERINAIRDEATEKKTELRTAFRNAENPEDLLREQESLKELITAKKAHYDALGIAQEVLENSFHEMRRSYGSEVERATLDIFKKLTGGRYSSLSVSKSLDMAVEQTELFGTHEIGYLSQGTVDQAYLSLRLAISRLISDGKPMPVFLDDSLSFYDDKRTTAALEFLKEYSLSTQLLMFTCHNSISESAKELGATVLRPFAK